MKRLTVTFQDTHPGDFTTTWSGAPVLILSCDTTVGRCDLVDIHVLVQGQIIKWRPYGDASLEVIRAETLK